MCPPVIASSPSLAVWIFLCPLSGLPLANRNSETLVRLGSTHPSPFRSRAGCQPSRPATFHTVEKSGRSRCSARIVQGGGRRGWIQTRGHCSCCIPPFAATRHGHGCIRCQYVRLRHFTVRPRSRPSERHSNGCEVATRAPVAAPRSSSSPSPK